MGSEEALFKDNLKKCNKIFYGQGLMQRHKIINITDQNMS